MSSLLGDGAEACQTHKPFVATHMAKFERILRELSDGASTGGPMPAAPTGAGDDAAGRRDASSDDDAVVAAAAVAAAQFSRKGGARDAQEAANVRGQVAVYAAVVGAGDKAGVVLSAGRIVGDGNGNEINKPDAGLCVYRGPALVAANALSAFEGPAFFIPKVPVEAASKHADHGGKRKAVGGPLECGKVGGKKVKVEGHAAWNEACRDGGTSVTQGSMADHQPPRPDEFEAAEMAVEDIGRSAAAFETPMNNLRALSAPHYTVMRLLATKTAAVKSTSLLRVRRTARRFAGPPRATMRCRPFTRSTRAPSSAPLCRPPRRPCCLPRLTRPPTTSTEVIERHLRLVAQPRRRRWRATVITVMSFSLASHLHGKSCSSARPRALPRTRVTAGSNTQANLVPRTRATTRALAWPAVAARAWPTDVSVFVPILACSGARMGIEGV